MHQKPFRDHHLLKLLQDFGERNLPIDLCMRDYFRANKSLGSKDRAEIAETAYALIRWKGLLNHFAANSTWDALLDAYRIFDRLDSSQLPEHMQVSFPQDLYNKIVESYGKAEARRICLASNERAPTTVRVNRLKIKRDDLIKKWKKTYDVSPCEHSPDGIVFHQKINFFILPEFREGLFEVQDEGSQIAGSMVQVEPGQQVIDYCSGSGGKTLAFAPKMENRGQIYLHDIRPWILDEAKRRMRRAGVQNAQIVKHDAPKLKKLHGKMDWALVDAPCSGTGTLRRNPDMKWKYSDEMLDRLIGQQRMIFEKALSFVKRGGRIVYATCSILKDENDKQTAHFLSRYPLTQAGQPFQSIPNNGGMDGFYAIVFRKN